MPHETMAGMSCQIEHGQVVRAQLAFVINRRNVQFRAGQNSLQVKRCDQQFIIF